MYLLLSEKHHKVIRKFQRQQKIFHDKTITNERALNMIFEDMNKILDFREIRNRDQAYRDQQKLI